MTVMVVIMEDMLLVQGLEALSAVALAPHLVPIFKQKLGELAPEHRGAGFLVNAENHCFLISAAHVLDSPGLTSELFCYLNERHPRFLLGQRPSRLTDPPPGKNKLDDLIDVGVCYLGPLSSLPGVEQIALPLDRLRPAALPRGDKWYILAGFPGGSNQVNIDRRAKHITSNRVTTFARSRPTKVCHKCKVTPETHIVIEHTRDLRSKLSNRTGKFPKTRGMSGSPLWFLPEKSHEEFYIKPLPIVGVFIRYDGPRRALISTDIGEALKLDFVHSEIGA
jgi:hypothetical protein